MTTDAVQVNPETLAKLLERVRDVAFSHHAKYSHASKSWPFDDEIWRAADPYEFGLYAELRAAISSGDQSPDPQRKE